MPMMIRVIYTHNMFKYKAMNKTFYFVNTSTMEEELILAKDLIDAKNKLCQKLFGVDYFTEDALEGWELRMAQG